MNCFILGPAESRLDPVCMCVSITSKIINIWNQYAHLFTRKTNLLRVLQYLPPALIIVVPFRWSRTSRWCVQARRNTGNSPMGSPLTISLGPPTWMPHKGLEKKNKVIKHFSNVGGSLFIISRENRNDLVRACARRDSVDRTDGISSRDWD